MSPRTRNYVALYHGNRPPRSLFEQYLRVLWLQHINTIKQASAAELHKIRLTLRDLGNYLSSTKQNQGRRMVQRHGQNALHVEIALASPYIQRELAIFKS